MPFVEGVISSLVASAIARVGNQVLVGAARLRGKDKEQELEAAKLLTSFTFSDSSLRAMIELPPNVTADDIDRVIGTPVCEAIAFECLAVVLTDAPEQSLSHARQRWITVMTSTNLQSQISGSVCKIVRLISSETADSLFDILLDQTRIAASIVHEQFPATYSRLRSEAFYARLAYTIENISREDTLDGLKTDKPIDAVIGSYKDRVRKALRYLTPDFDKRRFVPLEDLYVGPTIVDSSKPTERLGEGLEEYIDRTVLLGHPGNGKSTAGQIVTYRLAGRAREHLQQLGLNAKDVKHLPGRPKTDRLDAVWLSKVAERQMLRPSFARPATSADCETSPATAPIWSESATPRRTGWTTAGRRLPETVGRGLRHLRRLRVGDDGGLDRRGT